MGSMSLIHWIILGAVALLLFGGRGKISDVMGDVAKGIKSFKRGLADDEEEQRRPIARPADDLRTLDHYPPAREPVSQGDASSEPRKYG